MIVEALTAVHKRNASERVIFDTPSMSQRDIDEVEHQRLSSRLLCSKRTRRRRVRHSSTTPAAASTPAPSASPQVLRERTDGIAVARVSVLHEFKLLLQSLVFHFIQTVSRKEWTDDA